ncbi:hypothetical protein, partial [Pseudomonas granadensis]|uniref:hypothetical protein n=1 Tax=Pseudomonas granadensis TaxID=1421430 RepID=UPI0019D1F328
SKAFWFLFAGPALRRLKKGLAVRAKPPSASPTKTDIHPKPMSLVGPQAAKAKKKAPQNEGPKKTITNPNQVI